MSILESPWSRQWHVSVHFGPSSGWWLPVWIRKVMLVKTMTLKVKIVGFSGKKTCRTHQIRFYWDKRKWFHKTGKPVLSILKCSGCWDVYLQGILNSFLFVWMCLDCFMDICAIKIFKENSVCKRKVKYLWSKKSTSISIEIL